MLQDLSLTEGAGNYQQADIDSKERLDEHTAVRLEPSHSAHSISVLQPSPSYDVAHAAPPAPHEERSSSVTHTAVAVHDSVDAAPSETESSALYDAVDVSLDHVSDVPLGAHSPAPVPAPLRAANAHSSSDMAPTGYVSEVLLQRAQQQYDSLLHSYDKLKSLSRDSLSKENHYESMLAEYASRIDALESQLAAAHTMQQHSSLDAYAQKHANSVQPPVPLIDPLLSPSDGQPSAAGVGGRAESLMSNGARLFSRSSILSSLANSSNSIIQQLTQSNDSSEVHPSGSYEDLLARSSDQQLRIQELTMQVEALEATRTDLQAEIASLKQQIPTAEHMQQYHDVIKGLQLDVQAGQSLAADYAALQQAHRHTNELYEQLQQSYADRDADIEANAELIRTLQHELLSVRGTVMTLEAIRSEHTRCTTQINELQTELSHVHHDRDRLQSYVHELERTTMLMRGEMSVLMQRMRALTEERDREWIERKDMAKLFCSLFEQDKIGSMQDRLQLLYTTLQLSPDECARLNAAMQQRQGGWRLFGANNFVSNLFSNKVTLPCILHSQAMLHCIIQHFTLCAFIACVLLHRLPQLPRAARRPPHRAVPVSASSSSSFSCVRVIPVLTSPLRSQRPLQLPRPSDRAPHSPHHWRRHMWLLLMLCRRKGLTGTH